MSFLLGVTLISCSRDIFMDFALAECSWACGQAWHLAHLTLKQEIEYYRKKTWPWEIQGIFYEMRPKNEWNFSGQVGYNLYLQWLSLLNFIPQMVYSTRNTTYMVEFLFVLDSTIQWDRETQKTPIPVPSTSDCVSNGIMLVVKTMICWSHF